jgi:hypothetical protein
MWSKNTDKVFRLGLWLAMVSMAMLLVACDECASSKDCASDEICKSGECKAGASGIPNGDADVDSDVDGDTDSDSDTDTDTGQPQGSPCEEDKDCAADDDPCTTAYCFEGESLSLECHQVASSGAACEFAGNDLCSGGICQEGECVAGNPLPNGSPCPDTQWCNGVEICSSGKCVSGIPACGATSDLCTKKACTEPEAGAVEGLCGSTEAKAEGESCDNGVYCDGEETCKSGVCTVTTYACDGVEKTACESVICNEIETKCETISEGMNGMSCSDNAVCNGDEKCKDGVCESGLPYCLMPTTCQTSNCVEKGSGLADCADEINVVNGTACSLASPCGGSGTQQCVGGTCGHGEIGPCEYWGDNNFCTVYYMCDPDEFGAAECLGAKTVKLSEINLSTLALVDGVPTDAKSSFDFNTISEYNDVSTYSSDYCDGSYTGGEQIFELNLVSGENYTISLDIEDASGDLADMKILLLLDLCSPTTSCFKTSFDSSGIQRLNFSADIIIDQAGKDVVYVVIDGLNGGRAKGMISVY